MFYFLESNDTHSNTTTSTSSWINRIDWLLVGLVAAIVLLILMILIVIYYRIKPKERREKKKMKKKRKTKSPPKSSPKLAQSFIGKSDIARNEISQCAMKKSSLKKISLSTKKSQTTKKGLNSSQIEKNKIKTWINKTEDDVSTRLNTMRSKGHRDFKLADNIKKYLGSKFKTYDAKHDKDGSSKIRTPDESQHNIFQKAQQTFRSQGKPKSQKSEIQEIIKTKDKCKDQFMKLKSIREASEEEAIPTPTKQVRKFWKSTLEPEKSVTCTMPKRSVKEEIAKKKVSNDDIPSATKRKRLWKTSDQPDRSVTWIMPDSSDNEKTIKLSDRVNQYLSKSKRLSNVRSNKVQSSSRTIRSKINTNRWQ